MKMVKAYYFLYERIFLVSLCDNLTNIYHENLKDTLAHITRFVKAPKKRPVFRFFTWVLQVLKKPLKLPM